MTGSRSCGPPLGQLLLSEGAGVEKRKDSGAASASPEAPLVPAGTSTRKSVAWGNLPPWASSLCRRGAGSNSSVLVPSQRQRPGGVGVSVAGTVLAASSWEVTATMGLSKVMETCGAMGTSPSGE